MHTYICKHTYVNIHMYTCMLSYYDYRDNQMKQSNKNTHLVKDQHAFEVSAAPFHYLCSFACECF